MSIKKAKIKLPESINDITLVQYQDFIKKIKGAEDNELFVKQNMIHCFCGVDFTDVLLIVQKDFEEICDYLNSLFEAERPLNMRFELKGVQFGMIPNFEKITISEYADLDNYIDEWEDAHKLMAVMFRPIEEEYKGKYRIKEYQGTDEWADVMRVMPLGVALSARVFFYHLGKELLKAFPDYLQREVEGVTSQSKHNSTASGGGTHHFTHLLKETLEDLMK